WPVREADGRSRLVAIGGRLRLSNAEVCLAAAIAGLGIACVPSFVAAPAIREGRLHHVLPESEPEPYGLYALYPHSRHLAAKVRLLVDLLTERFRATPPWDAGWLD